MRRKRKAIKLPTVKKKKKKKSASYLLSVICCMPSRLRIFVCQVTSYGKIQTNFLANPINQLYFNYTFINFKKKVTPEASVTVTVPPMAARVLYHRTQSPPTQQLGQQWRPVPRTSPPQADSSFSVKVLVETSALR